MSTLVPICLSLVCAALPMPNGPAVIASPRAVTLPQDPTKPEAKPNGATTPRPAPREHVPAVQYDPKTGWPIVPETRGAESTSPVATPPNAAAAQPPAAPLGDHKPTTKANAFDAFPNSPAPAPASDARGANPPAIASGMQLGSPLLDVYQAVRSPAAFRELGGVVVWWRLSTYGEQGELIGLREVTHTADCGFAERDRLEYQDGRIYGRVGAQVFAELRGMPWPTLNDAAAQDLMLFGLQLRLPWAFADANTFAVVGKDVEERSGERFARIEVERRPPPALEVVGPEQDPKPRDRFQLLTEPSSGLPRELVHRFACSLQTRRVLLEDWRDVEGVRMPFRRVYVDEALRPKTTIEILRIERQRVAERDFRLL